MEKFMAFSYKNNIKLGHICCSGKGCKIISDNKKFKINDIINLN